MALLSETPWLNYPGDKVDQEEVPAKRSLALKKRIQFMSIYRSTGMEDFGWEAGTEEVTERESFWNNDSLGSGYSLMELQRAQTSLIENSNSASLARKNSEVLPSVLIVPMSRQVDPVLSSRIRSLQPMGTIMAATQADINGLSFIDTNTKDSLDDTLDCLFSTTNSSANGSVEEEGATTSPPAMMQNIHSGSFWNFGSSRTLSSGESDDHSSGMLDHNAKAVEGTNKRKSIISESGFRLISEVDPPKFKKARPGKTPSHNNRNLAASSSNISFKLHPAGSLSPTSSIDHEPDQEAIAQMKEMIYRAAAFRPVNLGFEIVEKPKRKNVRISSDPQTVAARQRRERIGERIRVLQRLVPGGTKMDTASMLDEAANYLKFLQSQIKALENLGPKLDSSPTTCHPISNLTFSSLSF